MSDNSQSSTDGSVTKEDRKDERSNRHSLEENYAVASLRKKVKLFIPTLICKHKDIIG